MKEIRTFEHFPPEAECPICWSNEDKETVLIQIADTADGKICEAIPTHLDCVHPEAMVWHPSAKAIVIRSHFT